MKINFDAALAVLSPAPVTLTIGGRDYPLRELETGEVLLLGAFGSGGDEERDLDFLQGLFAGEAPPLLEEIREPMRRLKALRQAAVGMFPALAELKDDAGKARVILSTDLRAAGGGSIPQELADFQSVEHRYSQLNLAVSLLQWAISSAVMETTPKNSFPAAMAIISRQLKTATDSPASPASASPSPG